MPHLRLGSAGRGLAYILGGSVGAQVITLAALPLLSRIFTPGEFGFFTLVTALAAFVAPTATLRWETAAMLPDHVEPVRALVWNAFFATAAIATLYALLLHSLSILGMGDLANYPLTAAWVFISVVLAAIFSIFSQLSLRKQEYSLVAKRTLLRSIATALTQLCAGAVGRTMDGLVLGATVGSAVGISTMVGRTREFLPFPGWAAVGEVWRKYWRFPAVFAPSALLNSAGIAIPLIFFTFHFGISVGGQLGMAERIVALPLTLIGAAVGQVIDAEISKRIREGAGGLLRSYLLVSVALSSLAVTVALALGILGPWVSPWLLGEEWVLAGHFIQALALSAGLRLVANPLSKYLLLMQKSMAITLLDSLRVILMVAAMASVAVYEIAVLPAIWLVYSALSVTYVVTWLYTFMLVRRRDLSN